MIMAALYPIKFKPIYKEKIWGGRKMEALLNRNKLPNGNIGESWELSAVQGNLSVVSNGFLEGNNIQELIEIYMADLVGEKVYEKYGVEFPLLIKFIDANDDLSIQVHPDDKLAKERHNAYGKTEMWYIVGVEQGASLISGFNKELDKAEYLQHLNAGTLPDIMNRETVKPDDVFFMPPGRVHAIGSGTLLAEIQQTSDITYRMYDWGRVDDQGNPRELHTDLALDAIDYTYHENYRTNFDAKKNATVETASCEYFTTNVIHFDQPVEKDYNYIDSFVILICLEGNLTIRYSQSEALQVEKGETVLVPAELKNIILQPSIESKVLEVYIK